MGLFKEFIKEVHNHQACAFCRLLGSPQSAVLDIIEDRKIKHDNFVFATRRGSPKYMFRRPYLFTMLY